MLNYYTTDGSCVTQYRLKAIATSRGFPAEFGNIRFDWNIGATGEHLQIENIYKCITRCSVIIRKLIVLPSPTQRVYYLSLCILDF